MNRTLQDESDESRRIRLAALPVDCPLLPGSLGKCAQIRTDLHLIRCPNRVGARPEGSAAWLLAARSVLEKATGQLDTHLYICIIYRRSTFRVDSPPKECSSPCYQTGALRMTGSQLVPAPQQSTTVTAPKPPKLLDQVRAAIRVRH